MSDKIVEVIKKRNPSMKMREGPDTIFHLAPLLIVITSPKDSDWAICDASVAIQNMMLYAKSIGLGSCFIGMSRFINEDKEMLAGLNITDDKKVVAAMICGYPDEEPEMKEKTIKTEFFE